MWIATTEARGVKQPHHVHLRDGVQTLHLNVHSHRNRRTCEGDGEGRQRRRCYFQPDVFISPNKTRGGSVAITTESD